MNDCLVVAVICFISINMLVFVSLVFPIFPSAAPQLVALVALVPFCPQIFASRLIAMAKRGITYIKGEEPNFLKKFKQQVTSSGERHQIDPLVVFRSSSFFLLPKPSIICRNSSPRRSATKKMQRSKTNFRKTRNWLKVRIQMRRRRMMKNHR